MGNKLWFATVQNSINIFEPAYDKTYNKTCATSEDPDQPAYPRSLIRVLADCMCLLQPPGCQKRDKPCGYTGLSESQSVIQVLVYI